MKHFSLLIIASDAALFIISTLRISLIQASQIFTTYLTDQLAHESELEEQLEAGDITDLQLDLETALKNGNGMGDGAA